MLSDGTAVAIFGMTISCLNAPCGAGCFLIRSTTGSETFVTTSLNAPSGAGCFLTEEWEKIDQEVIQS